MRTDKRTSFLIKKPAFVVCGLSVCVVAALLRLACVIDYPSTDEGFYALHAMLAHTTIAAGEGLPPLGVLHLYPILCSFVFSWDINHIMALRLCDMVVACLVAWQLFRLTCQESGSLFAGTLIALVFCFAINQPLFIQSGFKNSGFIAWLCLLPAIRMGLAARPEHCRTFFFCGALTCLGIFFRESFAPLALVGFIAAWAAKGRTPALLYAAGGILTALTVAAAIVALRGGVDNIIEAYAMFSAMAVALGAKTANTLYYVKASLQECRFLAPLLAATVLFVVLGFGKKEIAFGPLLFRLAICFAPLAEVVTKGGYGYHFSFCLYGLAVLSAYVFRRLPEGMSIRKSVACCGMCSSLLWAFALAAWLPQRVAHALPQAAHMLPQQKWPQHMIDTSNYLLMAKAVADNSRRGESLQISGCYHLLHVLTLNPPPPDKSDHLSDIGLYAVVKSLTAAEVRTHLALHAPKVLVLSERSGFNVEVVQEALRDMPEYTEAAYVGESNTRHYGGFTGKVFVRNE